MKLKFAVACLSVLGGIAAAGSASAAMPNGLPSGAAPGGNVENVRIVCDVYGRCYRRPSFVYGPRYYGGYGDGYGYPRPRFYGGYGGPRFFGGGRHRW